MKTITVTHNGVKKQMVVRPRLVGLGDKVEHLIGKIPGVKKLPCYDKDGKLKPESGCGKRKQKLNKMGQRIGLSELKRLAMDSQE